MAVEVDNEVFGTYRLKEQHSSQTNQEDIIQIKLISFKQQFLLEVVKIASHCHLCYFRKNQIRSKMTRLMRIYHALEIYVKAELIIFLQEPYIKATVLYWHYFNTTTTFEWDPGYFVFTMLMDLTKEINRGLTKNMEQIEFTIVKVNLTRGHSFHA